MAPAPTLQIRVLEGTYAVCRFEADQPVPGWAANPPFYSITRAPDELTIVCAQANVPDGIKCERGWQCFQLVGRFDLAAVGVLASVAVPLAEAGVAIFALSTFDTDYLFVKEQNLEQARAALAKKGHLIE